MRVVDRYYQSNENPINQSQPPKFKAFSLIWYPTVCKCHAPMSESFNSTCLLFVYLFYNLWFPANNVTNDHHSWLVQIFTKLAILSICTCHCMKIVPRRICFIELAFPRIFHFILHSSVTKLSLDAFTAEEGERLNRLGR